MDKRIALINDYKTRIHGTRTFWHFLEEILDAEFFSIKKWFWKKHLNKFNPDIVIQNAFWGNLELPQRPIIMLIQDNYHALMKNGFLDKTICMKKIEDIQRAVNIADHVVVNVKSLLRLYNIQPTKGSWIPMGVNGSVFYPSQVEREQTRKELEISGKCNIFVGDETPIHGWDKVKQKIEEDNNTWILVSKNKDFSIKGTSIKKFCNIDHDMLRKLYNAADLFFARGSIGLPAIEAMLCGTPIDVSHDIGYFEDWYPDNIDPRSEAIKAGFELQDSTAKWKYIVIEQFKKSNS